MPIAGEGVIVAGRRPRSGLRLGEWLNRETVLGPLFVTPALLLLLVLVAYPFCMALYFSLSDAFIGRPSRFIGIRNFVNLWQSDSFRQTFQNAFVFTFVAIAFKLVLGVTLALLLNQQLWFKRLIRGAVLLPWVIPTALSTLGWWWMFNSLYSVVNWTGIALNFMDPPGPNWLGQKYYAMAAVIAVNIWRGLPFFAITILAGLIAIPKELYEAAEADGAGPWRQFWYITLPLLKPVLGIVILFSTIFTFSEFNIVYVLTQGGPINSTHLFATLARQVGLETGRIGEGAAISLYLFPVLIFVVWAQLRSVRRQVL
jgi:multiple sugar transport system permease protein